MKTLKDTTLNLIEQGAKDIAIAALTKAKEIGAVDKIDLDKLRSAAQQFKNTDKFSIGEFTDALEKEGVDKDKIFNVVVAMSAFMDLTEEGIDYVAASMAASLLGRATRRIDVFILWYHYLDKTTIEALKILETVAQEMKQQTGDQNLTDLIKKAAATAILLKEVD